MLFDCINNVFDAEISTPLEKYQRNLRNVFTSIQTLNGSTSQGLSKTQNVEKCVLHELMERNFHQCLNIL